MVVSSKDIEKAPANGAELLDISSTKLKAKTWGINVTPIRPLAVVLKPRDTWGVR